MNGVVLAYNSSGSGTMVLWVPKRRRRAKAVGCHQLRPLLSLQRNRLQFSSGLQANNQRNSPVSGCVVRAGRGVRVTAWGPDPGREPAEKLLQGRWLFSSGGICPACSLCAAGTVLQTPSLEQWGRGEEGEQRRCLNRCLTWLQRHIQSPCHRVSWGHAG